MQALIYFKNHLIITSIWLLFLHTASAQDQWKLSLGASYRNFDDIDFKSFNFRNFDNVDTASGPFGIQNLAPIEPTLPDGQITLDTVRFIGTSADVDFSDSLSPIVIGLEAVFDLGLRPEVENTFSISIVSNLQYFNVEVSESEQGNSTNAGQFEGRQFNYQVLGGVLVLPPINLDNPTIGLASGTTTTVINEFDMELYVLDLGVKPSFTTDRLSSGVAVGVAINFVDISTSQTEQGAFTIIPSGEYNLTRKNSESDILLGAYAAFSLEVGITEHIGLAFEYRYDWVDDDDAGTSQVDADLKGQSGLIRAVYRF